MPNARFRIRKHRGDFPSIALPLYPWRLTDAARPAFLGQYQTHAKAVAAVEATIRREAGLPPKLDLPLDEIRAAMRESAPSVTR